MTRDRALLALSGAALVLTQYVAVREIGSTFFSTELVVLGAVVVTMIGPSVGYAVAHRLSDRALAVWGALSVAAHLALPVGLRALVGALADRDLEGWAIGGTVVGGSLLLCGFYAVFLPRQAREPASLPALYAAELAGALGGLALLLLSPSWRVTLAGYWAIAALVVHLGLRRRALTVAVAAAAAAMAIAYPALDRAAAGVYFRGYWGLERPTIVATEYSPYQRIDVVDDADGRSLYLDGVPFFRAGDLDAFNVFLADVPGTLHPAAGRGRAVVIGSGSFSSAAFLHRRGWQVTVVELDGGVARLGFEHFAAVHRLRAGDVRVVVVDGRRFLAGSPAGAFDLIVLDVPAPYHVQTALLHTPAFYRLVASRLAPGGVAAVSLCGELDGEVGGAIAASAARAFGEVMVVESDAVGLGLLYAGARLPFDSATVAREVVAREASGGRILGDRDVRARLAGVAPLDDGRLAAVLALARGELEAAFR